MKAIATLVTIGAAIAALGGCSASGTNPTAPSRVCNLAANVLQLNVGTANLFGDAPAAAVAGTNVAVTYRQSASPNCFVGTSGSLVNSPTFTRPAALAGPPGSPDAFFATIVGGPDPSEVGKTSMTSTSQAPNASNTTTFGTEGGAFGIGLEPFNTSTVAGQPDSMLSNRDGSPVSLRIYPVPLYDAIVAGGAVDSNQFNPGGGPPAFDISGNVAATSVGFNAVSEGLDVFAIAPALGAYSLSVVVPANTGAITSTAMATMSSATLLPAFVAPVPMVSATGVVTAPVVLPAGVIEAYVQVVDYGPTAISDPGPPIIHASGCSSASATNPNYYTVVLKTSGIATFTGDAVCTAAQNTAANGGTATDGDAFTVQAIGFDYGAYEASYPNSLGQVSPSLAGTGASKQADVTISSQGLYNQPAAGGIINGGGGAILPAGAKRTGNATRR